MLVVAASGGGVGSEYSQKTSSHLTDVYIRCARSAVDTTSIYRSGEGLNLRARRGINHSSDNLEGVSVSLL